MTKSQKEFFSRKAQELVEELKEKLSPIPEPQQFNHCVDVTSKWKGQYFYIMQKYKCAPDSHRAVDFFEVGIARLKPVGKNLFHIAYFRHTGKWFPLDVYGELSYEEAKKMILEQAIFQVF